MTSSFIPGQATKLEMAHVLFMDIVGYSKLPMDRQEAVLRTLQAVVSATSEFLQAQANQEMIRLPTGDGMALVFFGDAEAATRCALEVSRTLKPHPEIPLRMGLHSGPVYRIADINANQNVAGGGINIAQRVMDCGDAGHILASQSVADVLGHLSSWKDYLHDIGEAEVKHGVRVHLYNLFTNEVGNAELPQKLQTAQRRLTAMRSKARSKKLALGMVAAGAIATLAIGGFLYPRHAHALTDKDTIVIADFTNTTGDTVFDDTLKQALAVVLGQSPFLNILSEDKARQTLRQMTRSPGERLTQDLAREVCQRAGSKAYLAGSIAALGTQYVIGLEALNCSSGDVLAREQMTATGKEKVLPMLGQAAAKLRGEVGESLNSVQKFDVPLEQATTNSLEALKNLALGTKTQGERGAAEAIPFYKRAIELDPNFAVAYASLGGSYHNLGEPSLAAENARKAYELRERVTERERFYITSRYYEYVIGDLEKARQSYELWAQTYPRDVVPAGNLNVICDYLGQYDKALAQSRESYRIVPDGLSYSNLVNAYLFLNRLEEARTTAEEAQTKNLDSPYLRVNLYALAFLQNDAAGMAQQVAWAAGKSGVEDALLEDEADTAAYSGRLAKARGFSRQAVASAERAEEKETAAGYEADAAVREALFGNEAEARQRAAAVLALSTGRDVQYGAALALALAGDAHRAQALADDLGKRFPEDTIVQFNYQPTIRAQFALERNDTSRAIEALQAATPYELGLPGTGSFTPGLYPVYVRGDAYLAAHQGIEAAAEFQKILGHHGVVQNGSIGALAHLGLGRAYVLQGDTGKASAAYQDFLTLWKDADPDIPILVVAKSEYAKLR
jgi:class 3 adenylate cyclase/tetratricopeptide (TPR) repeat protein